MELMTLVQLYPKYVATKRNNQIEIKIPQVE